MIATDMYFAIQNFADKCAVDVIQGEAWFQRGYSLCDVNVME